MLKLFVSACLIATVWGGTILPKDDRFNQGFILGGNDTDITEIPYQVYLMEGLSSSDKLSLRCGGSVISPKHIATAAHCVRDVQKKIFVRAGSSDAFDGGVTIEAEKIHIHPEYNSKLVDYDAAVLELKEPLKFSDKIKPIPIGSTEPKSGSVGRVSGWGLTAEDGMLPKTLQSVFVPVVEREACKKALKNLVITERMVCAGGVLGQDSCSYDSGGPLVVDGNLAGIVSFGSGCGNRDSPGVYTNVGYPQIFEFLKMHALRKSSIV